MIRFLSYLRFSGNESRSVNKRSDPFCRWWPAHEHGGGTTLMVANREITLHIVLKGCDAAREKRKIRNHQKPDLSDEKEILMLKIASIHEYFCKKSINVIKAKIFNFYCGNGKKLHVPNPAPLTCWWTACSCGTHGDHSPERNWTAGNGFSS